MSSADPVPVDAVCNICGGYGVTIPAAGTKMVCHACEGSGHYEQHPLLPWADFEPDPQMLAWLADLAEYQL